MKNIYPSTETKALKQQSFKMSVCKKILYLKLKCHLQRTEISSFQTLAVSRINDHAGSGLLTNTFWSYFLDP